MPAPMVQGMERAEVSEDTMSVVSHRSKASKRASHSSNGSKLKRSKTATTTQYENEEDRNAAEIKDLFTKAINNRHNAVEEMLAANLDPNTKDEHGNTILHVASQTAGAVSAMRAAQRSMLQHSICFALALCVVTYLVSALMPILMALVLSAWWMGALNYALFCSVP